jgi:transcriptional regulator with XRE-family HTH domain
VVLKEARTAAGFTQRDLAARAGVAQPGIARIERGRVSPTLDTLDRLLRACGKQLELVDRPGAGVDRSLIRERLRLSTTERARLTVREWVATRPFRRGRR